MHVQPSLGSQATPILHLSNFGFGELLFISQPLLSLALPGIESPYHCLQLFPPRSRLWCSRFATWRQKPLHSELPLAFQGCT